MQSKLASYYCIIAWMCMTGVSIFTVSRAFMDAVLYPKKIITAIVAVVFLFFALPIFLWAKNISWVIVYKQICRYTNILVLFEALIAISQYAGISPFYSECTAGTFNNIAGLAACFAVSFPLGFVFLEYYNTYERIFFYLSKFLGFAVLVIYESRIGCICILITGFLIVFKNFSYKKCSAIFLVFIALSFCAYFIKTQSTVGRLFIIERTMEMIMKHPLLGWGIGGFTKEYMNAQADYFATHSGSQFEMLADNIHHPLNEFLLIATNYGLLGLLIVLSIGFMVFLYYNHHKTKYGKEGCLIFLSLTLLSSFSYPFSYPFTWLLLVLSLLLIFSHALSHSINRFITTFFVFSMWSIGIFAFIPLKRELDFQLLWRRMSLLTRTQSFGKTKKAYDALYQYGKSNYFFLYDYACEAYDDGNYTLALKLSEEAEKYTSDYGFKMLMGDCYQSLDNIDNAIKCYQEAQHMCPLRLMPLYEIYNIYSSQNDTIKCRRQYMQIVQKEIKVKNPITEIIMNDIKGDMKRMGGLRTIP